MMMIRMSKITKILMQAMRYKNMIKKLMENVCVTRIIYNIFEEC